MKITFTPTLQTKCGKEIKAFPFYLCPGILQPVYQFRLWLLLLLVGYGATNTFGQNIVPTKGKDFWIGFTYHPEWSNSIGTRRFDVFVTADRSTTGTISIPRQGWTQTFSVTANQTTTVSVPINLAEHIASEVVEGKGVRVVTNDTVSVFAITFQKYTADASMILPKQSLGTDFRIASYPGINTSSQTNVASQFLIVATEDGTQVRITPSAPTLGNRPAGTPFIVNLNAGQSYHVLGKTYSDDFTGTKIEGTAASGQCRPFAVFSGSVCVNIPNGCTACDILYDQAFPIPTWGKNYFAAPFSFASSYTIRVLADQPNTIYTMNGVAQPPLAAGQFREFNSLTTPTCIQGNKPLSVVQYMEGVSCAGAGDPAMLYLNPEEQKIDNVTFSTVTSQVITQHSVNVVIKTLYSGQLTLDGVPVPPSQFKPFTACPNYVYAQLTLTQGSHTLNADSGFSAYIYGTGSAESYAYAAGSYSKSKPIVIDTVYCSSDTVRLGTLQPMYGHWWATSTLPNDTIHVGPVYLLTPPIVPDVYVLHGNEYISGCPKDLFFNVEVPDPPTLTVTQSADTICQYQPVQLNAIVTPYTPSYQYTWTPAAGLSNPNIPNPVATPGSSTKYVVEVKSPSGCGAMVSDSVFIFVQNGDISKFDVLVDDDKICIGDSAKLSMVIEKAIFEEDVDPAADNSLWTNISGGTASNVCGSLSGNGLYFNAAGTRSAATIGLNVSAGGTIKFGIKIADGVAPCDDADYGEDVVLEYSINGGGTWVLISTYFEWAYTNFTSISVTIPAGARTANTMFRWRQLANSGVNQDNWVLDDIVIGATTATNLSYSWSPATGLSATNISNPVAKPTVTTMYIGRAVDVNTGCTYADSVLITVGQNFTVNMIPDTSLCQLAGVLLYARPSIPGSGYTYRWSPGASLSDSTSATPAATPSVTTSYSVTVTSPTGCVRTGNTTVRFVSRAAYDAIPDVSAICTGQNVQADVLNASGCGAFGPPCTGNRDSLEIAPGLSTSSSSSITPYSGTYYSSRKQYLYLASELTALGLRAGSSISELAFRTTTVNGTPTYQNFTIKMGCTSLSSLTDDFVPGLATVFNPKTVVITTGQNYYPFDYGYDWDGVSNIIVEVCYRNSSSVTSVSVYYNTTGFNASTYQYSYSDMCNTPTGFSYIYRPNTRFKYCKSRASSITYAWTPVAGVSNPVIANPILTPATTTTYKVTMRDTVTGCIFTDSIRVNVGAPFPLTMSNDTVLCVASGVPLSVSHNTGPGAVYSWTPASTLSDATVYNPVASPLMSTTYYVSVTSAAGCTVSDSVRVRVVSRGSFDVIPNDTSICAGQQVAADIFASGNCGAFGSACANTDSAKIGPLLYSSSSSSITPFSGTYLSSRKQFLYLASELAAAGLYQGSTISQIALNLASGSGNTYQGFTIKIGCTSNTQTTSTFETGLTTVFNPKNITTTLGQNYFVFDNTYDWDGSSNLLIEICYLNTSTVSSSSIYYTTTTYNSTTYQYGSTSMCATPTGYTYYYRPYLTFGYCKTPAKNLAYNWVPVSGVSNPAIRNPVFTPAATTTYWVFATDTSTGCIFSDSLRINVGASFNLSVTNDTLLCLASGIPLYATNNAGSGATYLWQPSGTLSDPYSIDPLATPPYTTMYTVAVTSAAGCTKVDSVKVTVASLGTFNATPDTASICSGQSVQADVLRTTNCGTFGSICPATKDSIQVGTGASTSSSTSISPYNSLYISSKRQYLYRASELVALGLNQASTITQIAFNIATLGGITTYQGFTIKMGCTSQTTLTANYIAGLTTVFAPKTVNLNTGVNYYVFDNTYDWDGVSNLVVEVCFENTNSSSSSSIYYQAAGFTSSTYYYSSSTGICPSATGYTSSNRPNTKFKYCKTPVSNLVYSWTPALGVSNTAIRNPLLTPPTTTTYRVSAQDTVTGCSFSDTVTVKVGSINLTATAAPDTTVCNAVGLRLRVTHNSQSSVTYNWQPANRLSASTTATPVITVNGSQLYTVTVTDSLGCSTVRDTISIVVKNPAIITVSADTLICPGDTVQLTAAGGVAYAWTPVNSLNNAAIANPLAFPQLATTYRVSVTDSIGCVIQDSVSVSIKNPPSVYLGNDTSFCAGGQAVFTAPPGFTSYTWQDNSTGITFTATAAGNYWVRATGECGTYSDTVSILNVYPLPPVYLGGDTSLCSGQPLILDAGNPGSAYVWSGNATTARTLPVNLSGPYWVQVTDNNGCVATDTINVSFVVSPVVNIGNDTTLCAGISINLQADAGGNAYQWSTNETTPGITVSTAGTYWVKVTNSTNCSTFDTIDITYLPLITVNLAPDTTLCAGNPVTLDAGNPGWNYLWSDNSTTQTITPSTLSGNYWVQVSMNGFCAVSDSVQITFMPSPVLNLGNDTAICTGQLITLDAGNAGAIFNWTPANNTQTLTTGTAGIYTVTVTNSFNCATSDTISISVNPAPVVALGNDSTICQGQTLTLDAANPGAAYLWSNNQSTSTITVNTTGTFAVTVTDANQCKGQDSINVSVKAPPQLSVSANPNTVLCAGDSVLLTATAADGKTYQWTPVLALSSPGSASTWAKPQASITYMATVWDSIGCFSSDSVSITLKAIPYVNLGSDTSFCFGEQVVFNARAGFTDYLWQNGSTAQTFTATQAGTYWVQVSDQCGSARDTLVVNNVYPLPIVNLGPGGQLCAGPNLRLDAGNTGASYLWSTGATTQIIVPDSSGTYTVRITDQNQCVNTGNISIQIVTSPMVYLGEDTLLCGNATLLLNARYAHSYYLWQDGSSEPVFEVVKAGEYWVKVSNLCGEASDSLLVNTELCNCRIFVPNSFTPNNDQLNDIFRPEVSCDMRYYNLKVFNRWGELVFQSFNPADGWDGTYKGEKLAPQVFVYMIDYMGMEDKTPRTDKLKGGVTLLR